MQQQVSIPAPDAPPPAMRPSAPGAGSASADPFIGRTSELQTILGEYDVASSGEGRLLLLEGEAGAGKTRLAREAAVECERRGGLVLVADCDQVGAGPGLGPWTRILEQVARHVDPSTLPSLLADDAWVLASHVPALAPEPVTNEGTNLAPESARYRFHEAVFGFLTRASEARPILIFIDDIHCADESSLALLTFLSRRVAGASILLVAAYREEEFRDRRAAEETLGDLLSGPVVHRLALRGLDRNSIRDYLQARSGAQPSTQLLDTVHSASGGNALFVAEIVQILRTEGRLRKTVRGLETGWVIPVSLRSILGRRLRRLAAPDRELLELASVVGHSFPLRTLESVSPWSASEVRDGVHRIVEERILRESEEWPPSFEFSHGLIRETVYDQLPDERRRELHRAVRAALRSSSVDGYEDEDTAEAIAHHWLAAAHPGEEAEVAGCLMVVAERAKEKLAYERAAELASRAVTLLAATAPGSTEHCEALLFEARTRVFAGDPDGAQDSFARLAELGAQTGASRFLGEGALGFAGHTPRYGEPDPKRIVLLESALQALPPDPTPLRCRVAARLASELQYAEPITRRVALSDEALANARSLRDLKGLALVAMERHTRGCRTLSPHVRTQIIDELDAEAQAQGSIEGRLDAAGWRILDLYEAGEVAKVDVELERFARLAALTRHPLYLHRVLGHRAIRAAIAGNFDQAARFAFESVGMARTVSDWNANVTLGGQMFSVGRLRGNLDEVLPIALAVRDQFGSLAAIRAGVARAFAAVDQLGSARREFEALALDGFRTIPEDFFWLVTLGYLSEVCGILGDAPRARELYELLEPCAGRMMLAGLGGLFGSVNHCLGVCADTFGDVELSCDHFETALHEYATMGARPYAAITECHYATILAARGLPTDVDRARSLVASAQRTAEDCGMAGILISVQDLNRTLSDPPPKRACAELQAESPTRVFQRRGLRWLIGRREDAIQLPDTAGLRCIAELLRHPHQDVAVADVALAAGVAGGELRSVPINTAPDSDARRAYRERARELRQSLEEARENHDLGRIPSLETELHSIEDELTRGMGLGGRRRVDSANERARQNVTRAIRRAARSIARLDPSIGHHIDRSIRTGSVCRYDPEPDAEPHWVF